MMLMRLATLAGLTVAAATAAAPQDAAGLLAALDRTGFWTYEDHEREGALKAEVAAEGVVALYDSRPFVQLDAEDLAEGGIGNGLLRVGPHLRNRGLRQVGFQSVSIEPDCVVRLNGRGYTVYTAPDVTSEEGIWRLATETFLQILNDELVRHVNDRADAFYSGNDLMVAVLPPDLIPFFDVMPEGDRPIVPVRAASELGRSMGP